MEKKSATGLKKYRGLLTLIGLFLLLTVGVLVFNFFITRYFTQQSQITSLATQQGVFIQQMSKNLMDVDLYIQEQLQSRQKIDASMPVDESDLDTISLNELPQDSLNRIKEIQTLKDNFEKSLSAFEKGGEFDGVAVSALTGKAQKHVERIREIWNPYLGLIDHFISDTKSNKISAKTSDYLVDYTRLYNQTLLNETQAMANILNEHVVYRSNIVQMIIVSALAIAFLLFGLIIFGSFGQLLKSDALLERANQEMTEIMSSVNEGLFLVNKNLTIGSQYSKRLEEMIGQKDLANKDLLDVLSYLVSKDDLDTTKVFIDQLYSDWVVEDLIEDLNPLHRISIQNEDGNLKFLDFKFFRVWLNDKIERVLVSVNDTTESVMLQASLEAQKEQEGRELEMLNIILNTDATLLNSFIKGSLNRLNDINQVLKSPESNKIELRSKAQYIAREIHTVKGEASSLKLHRMVTICETFEESLNTIRNLPNLSGQDFLSLVVLLDDLYRLFDILEGYGTRLGTGSNTGLANETEQTPEQIARKFAQVQENYLKQFVTDIAARCDKKVDLTISGFDTSALTEQQWNKLKEIVIQLLRNAVVHGIELPEIRRQRNKSEIGSLKLSLREQPDGHLLLVSEDDGNGIDFNAIRSKAVALKLISQEDATTLDQRQMLNFMFSNGFSTATTETEDAGRGVGMDIIKETVQAMGGRISVATATEGYTRFSLIFPKSK